MGYATHSHLKEERKLGRKAARALEQDPNTDWNSVQTALKLPNIIQLFNDTDILSDKDFVEKMKKWRKDDPDTYSLFWWWRLAEEKNARAQEDDYGDEPARYRVFQIVQFLVEPFSDEWEDDRRTLKPGVIPLITEEQIEDGLKHKSIKEWAWIVHDRDAYTQKDEATDEEGLIRAGDRKFLHYHIVINLGKSSQTKRTVAKWFNVPEFLVKPVMGRGAFLDVEEYFLHESPAAVADEKTHYDDEDMHVNIGNDFRRDLDRLQANRAKYGKKADAMTPAETMKMHVLFDGWSLAECREDDPLTYVAVRSSLLPLRLDYLSTVQPPQFRINIYIDGPSGVGKSAFSEYLAEFLHGPRSYFCIGNDERVTFDGYDGQETIIWDDMRVTDFIRQFGSNGTYRILDPHPKLIAEQAKHSKVILTNSLNIINGIQPYEEFIAGLAGSYKDKFGVDHESEDETQSWRRFPLILCIHEDDFEVLLNRGFLERNMRGYQTMQSYACVHGSLRRLCQALEGEAKEKSLIVFGEPVRDAIKVIKGSNAEKIADPSQIPSDLIPHRLTSDEMEERRVRKEQEANEAREQREEEKKQREAEEIQRQENLKRLEHIKKEVLPEFVKYFWSDDSTKYIYEVVGNQFLIPDKAETNFAKVERLVMLSQMDLNWFIRGFHVFKPELSVDYSPSLLDDATLRDALKKGIQEQNPDAA